MAGSDVGKWSVRFADRSVIMDEMHSKPVSMSRRDFQSPSSTS